MHWAADMHTISVCYIKINLKTEAVTVLYQVPFIRGCKSFRVTAYFQSGRIPLGGMKMSDIIKDLH